MPNKSAFSRIAIVMIRMYQRFISPMICGKCMCRFTPTCSEYTRQAIDKYGFVRGVILGLKRISKCRPGGGYGYDPVP